MGDWGFGPFYRLWDHGFAFGGSAGRYARALTASAGARQLARSLTRPVAPPPALRREPSATPPRAGASLADKYDLSLEHAFVSGPQAVVRLLLMQKELDRRAGLDTAGFVSGYPGSPLGGLDHAFLKAGTVFAENDIRFQPGLNEDLAATAVWGSQQAQMRGEGRFDGVFALWYGKGPGVDRSGDALRHANLAGTAPHGGVLALIGDDHGAESSTTAHQSDFALVDAMIPILAPSGVAELIDFGLLGFSLSRFSGVWVGLKCLKDTVEATASITAGLDRRRPRLPALPGAAKADPNGLNIRPQDPVLTQEKRLHGEKQTAVLSFLRANGVNRIMADGGPAPRIGVAAAGKSWLDLRQALDLLGLGPSEMEALGLRLLKIGCVYPLDPDIAASFAQGLDLIMVVEEKRGLIEGQLREALYRAPFQPVVIGKTDEEGAPLFPSFGVIEAHQIALALGRRLLRAPGGAAAGEDAPGTAGAEARAASTPLDSGLDGGERSGALQTAEWERWAFRRIAEGAPEGRWIAKGAFADQGRPDPSLRRAALAQVKSRLEALRSEEARVARIERLAVLSAFPARQPYFCAGCPHNSSTRAPEGMRAHAGIGCHYLVQWMERGAEGVVQMGGEGANWVGEAPFSNRSHVIQNLGDGTYHHSGLLAIRFAAAAGVNITYKILFNGAIAMTGGQKLEGGLSVERLAHQLAAENVAAIAVVSDEPDKYPKTLDWPAGVQILPREKLEEAQRALARLPGVTALIYDETCASEKRRLRKRGDLAPAARRVVINERVCEGCGDCGLASNCVAIQPIETEFGRKRRIDQSSCNADLACLEGFCPALVSVPGAAPKKPALPPAAGPLPPPAEAPDLGRPYSVLIAGMGGTGVVTLAAVLGMASHIEGKGFGAIDMAGLAQKGGAVLSHVRIAARPEDIAAIRVGAGEADLLIGCDLMVAASVTVRTAISEGATRAVVNTAEVYPGEFTRNPDFAPPFATMRRTLEQDLGKALGAGPDEDAPGFFLNAGEAAQTLFGNSVAANMMLLGAACQRGLLPLGEGALRQAITLNGEAVETNLSAFDWGRRAVADPHGFAAALAALRPKREKPAAAQTLAEALAIRADFLKGYQNLSYAQRYLDRIERLRRAEAAMIESPGDQLAHDRNRHDAIGQDEDQDAALVVSRAAAEGLFRLMAAKDEYEVARLYTDGAFAEQAEAELDGPAGRLGFEFYFAAPFPRGVARGAFLRAAAETRRAIAWLMGSPSGPAVPEARKKGGPRAVKRRFGPSVLPILKALARLKFLRGTALDPFALQAERRFERKLLADYEILLDEIEAWLGPQNHAAAAALAALPQKIRGFGDVKRQNAEAAEALKPGLLKALRESSPPTGQ